MRPEVIFATADVPANLLKINFFGRIGAAEMEAHFHRVESLLPALRADFSILSDLTGLESMEISCVPFIEKIMDLCRERGVSLVVRVIPDPAKDIGFNIMSLFHYPRRVRIVTCKNRIEAERALKKKPGRAPAAGDPV